MTTAPIKQPPQVLVISCPHCLAGPGELCHTIGWTATTTVNPHEARTLAVKARSRAR